MFINPFDLSVSLWLTPVPEYELVPDVPIDAGVAPAAELPDCPPAPSFDPAAVPLDDTLAAASLTTAVTLPPRLRMVFKGMHWVACPVFSMRENPAWEQMTQIRREEDDQRSQRRARPGQPPVSPAAGAAGEPGSAGPPAAAD